jgi:long-chain acyl-CoA synthetase
MGEILSGARRMTTEELNLRAAKAASGLKSLGIGLNDTVAIYLRNDLAFFEAAFAAGLLGAYPVPVNWHYTEDEARYLFENCGAKLIVIHADFVAAVRAAFPKNATVLVVSTPPEIKQAYAISDELCEIGADMISWDQWVQSFPPLQPQSIEPPGAMIYTSGTTGRPKGVRRFAPTAGEALASTQILMRGFGFTDTDPAAIVTAVTGPMYHSAPNAYGAIAARLGGNVILQPRFDAEQLLALIERHRVTHMHMVPIMFNRLLKLPESQRNKYDLSSLKFIIHAAAPVSPPIKRAMIDWWGPIINEYYGTTETGILTFCSAQEWLAHPGTVGRPLPEVDLRIFDADGNPVSAGTAGEIAARARTIADFTYHGDDDKRKRADKEGLFVSGDIGYFDQDGFLYLCDRAKDMIISGGVNIYPAEIEAELHKMPGVADCAIFGIPDDEYGEAICAIVQTQPGTVLDSSAVKDYLRSRVAGYKVPKTVEFRPELPREDSGKIFKRKLREPYWANAGRQI